MIHEETGTIHPAGARRPLLEVLTRPTLERIVAEATDVLWKVGVFVEDEEALAVLAGGGARVEKATRRAFLPEDLIWRSVRSAPAAVTVWSPNGESSIRLEGLNVHFNPGSAAIKILDCENGRTRAPVTSDVIRFARLADALANLAAQSTALVPSDVPEAVADRYRLFLVLLNSSKPVVTGTFTLDGFVPMRAMLAAVAGDESALRLRPTAIFDACPSSPLKWSRLTAQSVLQCARSGLPAEIVSVPLLGATAPVTLAGALVQHTAENLSGIALHQAACPGSPVIYGGSPAVFDMRYGTLAVGAVETALVVCAYAQIGRSFGLPTHGYLGLSDAKALDAQAGLESGIGAVMAALAGVNMISGAGMMDFESCQCMEKLVVDDEICGMAMRLARGIEPRGEVLAEELFGDLSQGDHFLTAPSTLRWLREEIAFPSPVIDRQPRGHATEIGEKALLLRARQRMEELLARHVPSPLPDDVRKRLSEILSNDARRHGIDRLPCFDGS
jgi:trimethylamine--corrinoid protein Co-methyltransferase